MLYFCVLFMQFARAVAKGQDIVLKTDGMSVGNYCESFDAVDGILTVLYQGTDGEIYNVVNEKNTMRIREMAQLVADKIAGGAIRVVYDIADLSTTGYAPKTGLRLSSEKLRGLGWEPTCGMEEMYAALMEIIKEK